MRTSIYLALLASMMAWQSDSVRLEAKQLGLNMLGGVVPGVGNQLGGLTQGLGIGNGGDGGNGGINVGGLLAGGLDAVSNVVPGTNGNIIQDVSQMTEGTVNALQTQNFDQAVALGTQTAAGITAEYGNEDVANRILTAGDLASAGTSQLMNNDISGGLTSMGQSLGAAVGGTTGDQVGQISQTGVNTVDQLQQGNVQGAVTGGLQGVGQTVSINNPQLGQDFIDSSGGLGQMAGSLSTGQYGDALAYGAQGGTQFVNNANTAQTIQDLGTAGQIGINTGMQTNNAVQGITAGLGAYGVQENQALQNQAALNAQALQNQANLNQAALDAQTLQNQALQNQIALQNQQAALNEQAILNNQAVQQQNLQGQQGSTNVIYI